MGFLGFLGLVNHHESLMKVDQWSAQYSVLEEMMALSLCTGWLMKSRARLFSRLQLILIKAMGLLSSYLENG